MLAASLSDEIYEQFRALSTDRVERIEVGWAALLEGDARLLGQVRRDLHTVKGDSYVLGFAEVNLLCHSLEDLFAFAEQRGFDVPGPVDLMMTMGLRFITMLLLGKPGVALAGIDLDGFVRELGSVLTDARTHSEPITDARRLIRPIPGGERTDRLSDESVVELGSAGLRVFVAHLNAVGAARDGLSEAWRSIRRVLESVASVPIAPTIARHAEAATALARKLGKEAAVETSCGGVDVRRETIEAIDVALLHLLRNAVAHGVEAPEARRKAGKAPCGRLRITALSRTDTTEIRVDDDGGGIDTEHVRRVAVDRGLLSVEAAARADADALAELLFAPGFSTAPSVTEISGRGVGLDAVRAAVVLCGGTVDLRSVRGRGTSAVVIVPRSVHRLSIHWFKLPGCPVSICVDAAWRATTEAGQDSGDANDLFTEGVLEALGIRPKSYEASTRILRLERDGARFATKIAGPLRTASAERVFRTPSDALAEVILVAGEESLLVRPEVFLRAATRRHGGDA